MRAVSLVRLLYPIRPHGSSFNVLKPISLGIRLHTLYSSRIVVLFSEKYKRIPKNKSKPINPVKNSSN